MADDERLTGHMASRAVRAYLELLVSGATPPDEASIAAANARAERLRDEAAREPDVLARLTLMARADREAAGASIETERWREVDQRFVAAAADYANRHGIGYATWRNFGVPVATLRRAGLAPTATSRRPAAARTFTCNLERGEWEALKTYAAGIGVPVSTALLPVVVDYVKAGMPAVANQPRILKGTEYGGVAMTRRAMQSADWPLIEAAFADYPPNRVMRGAVRWMVANAG